MNDPKIAQEILSNLINEDIPIVLDSITGDDYGCRGCRKSSGIFIRFFKIHNWNTYTVVGDIHLQKIAYVYCAKCVSENCNSSFLNISEIREFRGFLESLYILSQ